MGGTPKTIGALLFKCDISLPVLNDNGCSHLFLKLPNLLGKTKNIAFTKAATRRKEITENLKRQ